MDERRARIYRMGFAISFTLLTYGRNERNERNE